MANPNVTFSTARFLVEDSDLAAWTVEFNEFGEPVKATGPCPSCGHDTTSDVIKHVVGKGLTGGAPGAAPLLRLPQIFTCACNNAHTAGEGSQSSCGRWWYVMVRLRGDGHPVTAPQDDRSLAAARALAADAKDEESWLRSSAEKWTTGVTALYGLFGLSGVVAGKDSIAALPTVARVVVGIVTAVGVACAAKAIFDSYRAAYGWPVLVGVGDEEKLRKWHAERRRQAESAATHLKRECSSRSPRSRHLSLPSPSSGSGHARPPSQPSS